VLSVSIRKTVEDRQRKLKKREKRRVNGKKERRAMLPPKLRESLRRVRRNNI